MNDLSLVLLLVVAIGIGWVLGRIDLRKNKTSDQPDTFSREYFKGLNFLLNEQPDKAIDAFVKALDVNSETVDTHLALGSVFRRRGEVDRAIRIHQNLLERPGLDRNLSQQVQLELAQDFLSAGLLDRAEALLSDIVEQGGDYAGRAIQSLIKIFEQEKEWQQAIVMGEKLLKIGSSSILAPLSHYCCELAELALDGRDYRSARNFLKQSLQYDKNCVRASLLQGQIETETENYKDAIKALKRINNQDSDYFSESVQPLSQCYERLGQERDLIKYFKSCIDDKPVASLVLALADLQYKSDGERSAVQTIQRYIQDRPSIKGLDRLIDIQLQNSDEAQQESLSYLKQLTEQLMSRKPVYRCQSCGFSGKTLYWMCPGCHSWGSVKPIQGVEGE